MSLTSYRAAPPRDPENNLIMPELFSHASAILENVKYFSAKKNREKVS